MITTPQDLSDEVTQRNPTLRQGQLTSALQSTAYETLKILRASEIHEPLKFTKRRRPFCKYGVDSKDASEDT